MKKIEKQQKKTQYKARRKEILIIMSICMAILMLNLVSAEFTFDNVKEYNSATKEVLIKNIWGANLTFLGFEDNIGKATLISNTDYCIINCEAEIKLELYNDYSNSISEVKTYLLDKKTKKSINSLRIQISDTTKDVEVPTFENVCKLIDANETKVEVCNDVQTGTKIIQERIYRTYKNEDLKAGTYYIKILGRKDARDDIEWIPTIFGVKIDEWATWSASLDVGLFAYYNFTDVKDQVSGYNLVNGAKAIFVENASTKTGFGKAGFVSATGGFNISDNDAIDFVANDYSFTLNVWLRINDTKVGSYVINKQGTLQTLTDSNDTGNMMYSTTPNTFPSSQGFKNDTWFMLTYTRNSTHTCMFINGTQAGQDNPHCVTRSTAVANKYNLTIGSTSDIGDYLFQGYVDELGLWNRSLSTTEISDLYNGGTGLSRDGFNPNADLPPVINLTSPANNTNFSTSSINLSCRATDTKGLSNISLFINGERNYTFLIAGGNKSDGFKTSSIGSSTPTGIEPYNSDGSLWIVDNADKFLYHVSSTGVNQSDGIKLTDFGISSPYGLTINQTDGSFWITDITDNFIYHISSTGVNLSDGFKTDTFGSNEPVGITFNVTNNSFWITDDLTDFAYHVSPTGVELADSILISAFGSDDSREIIQDKVDGSFWIVDSSDQFVYHISSLGVNLSDGFKTSEFVINSPFPLGLTLSGNNQSMWVTELTSTFAYHLNLSAKYNQNLTINRNFDDGVYLWNCRARDTNNSYSFDGNRTFTIDTKNPSVNLSESNRTIQYHVLGTNLTLNWSVTDLTLDNCSVFFQGVMYRPACADKNISFNISNYEYRTINFTATDTFNNINETNISWEYLVFQNEISYTRNTTEGSNEEIWFNITKLNGKVMSYVSLVYNSLGNTLTYTSASNQKVSKNISIPSTATNTNYTFYLVVNFTDGSYGISPLYQQQVKVLSLDNCTNYDNQLFNITIFDEENLQILEADTNHTALRLTIEVSNSNGVQVLNYSNYSISNPTRVCFENPLSDTATYVIDGVLEYSSEFRFTEFYHLQNYLLTNNTNNVSIFLYNLNSTKGNEFKITYKDANFVPVENALIQIQRKYIDEGLFRTTEIPKTGPEGYTIGHLVPNDVIYNILVLKNGVILATFEDIVANCQNPALEDCVINLNSLSTSSLPSSFAEYNDFTYNLEYNPDTREISSLSSIPSGVSGTIVLNVTLFDTLGNRTICTDSLVGSGGQLSCTIPNSFGNTSVWAILSKDGKRVGQSVISLTERPSERYGSNLLFIALFVIFMFIGLAINDNPLIYGIVFFIGIATMFALNILYSPSVIGSGSLLLYLFIGILIIMIRGSNRQ